MVVKRWVSWTKVIFRCFKFSFYTIPEKMRVSYQLLGRLKSGNCTLSWNPGRGNSSLYWLTMFMQQSSKETSKNIFPKFKTHYTVKRPLIPYMVKSAKYYFLALKWWQRLSRKSQQVSSQLQYLLESYSLPKCWWAIIAIPPVRNRANRNCTAQ